MRAGARKESVDSRGRTTWSDGLDSVDGGGAGNGSLSETQGTDDRTGGSFGGGEGGVSEKTWFTPIEGSTSPDIITFGECKDGVCPVPWAKTADLLSESMFLSSDRNSNFPGENTIETNPVPKEDVVNHPYHYTDGAIECIEAIEAALTDEEFRGYCKGNCIKYIWRERHKGGTESLKKAQWYLNRLIERDEN